MDHKALEALIATYRAHPEPKLLALILDGAGQGEPSTAVLTLVEALDPSALEPATRRQAANSALHAEAFGLALRLALVGTEPPDLILAARAHRGLGDRAAAKAAYAGAIKANPALEDVELARAIDAPDPEEGERLANVISIASRRGERRIESERSGGTAAASLLPSLAEQTARPITFADVGGLDDVKAQIRRRIITPFLKPALFDTFRRKAGGGVLLYGPPGCGKTLLARATAGECRARFINIHIAEVLDMYVGQSEKRLAAAFEEARRETPAILFFDEIEALAARRRYGSNDASASLVSTFLSELDGFQQNNAGVLVLAATNVPWAVDAAFRRPGRFDRIHFVPPPDLTARLDILTGLVKGLPGAEDLVLVRLAESTSGYSGADLKNLVDTASDLAIEASLAAQTQGALTMALFATALEDVKPTTLEWLTTARNYAKYSNSGGQYDDVLRFLERHGR